jgi:hypothetical protein
MAAWTRLGDHPRPQTKKERIMNPHLVLAVAAARQDDLRRAAQCCRVIIGRAHRSPRWRRLTLSKSGVNVSAGACVSCP